MAPEVISTGAVNWDINLFVDTLSPGGIELPVKKITRVPGGKAANVAVAAARLLGPGRSGILGAVGKDEVGVKQKKIFEDEGVETSALIFLDDIESGQAYILIDPKGKNQIFTYFGANAYLRPDLLARAEVKEAVRKCSIMIAMDPPLEYVEELFRLTKDKMIIWAPGVRTLNHQDEILRLISNVNYMVLNREELKLLTGYDDPALGYQVLSERAERLKLIATRGERGAVLIHKDHSINVQGIDLEKAGKKVINTVGCGDAFIGSFAASLLQGYDERESLERANAAAAFKATMLETRGSPTLKQLEEFMHAIGKRF